MITEIISLDEVEQMNIYVMYRAEKAFYDTFYDAFKNDQDDELSWDEYIHCLRASEDARRLIRREIKSAYSRFKSKYFDFENMEDINWQIEDTQLCQLYENDMGKKRVYQFMLKTQLAYYRYLRKKDRTLKWSAFITIIMLDNSKSEVLRKAFLRGLTELEFSID